MAKFRKKPVVIEAIQFKGGQIAPIEEAPQWLLEACLDQRITREPHGTLWIKTLEGGHRCSVNDWIIRGVQGELYPCKPDIFEATYEPAE